MVTAERALLFSMLLPLLPFWHKGLFINGITHGDGRGREGFDRKVTCHDVITGVGVVGRKFPCRATGGLCLPVIFCC